MFLQLFLISLPIFIALDLTWLGIVAKKFYTKHLGSLMAKKVNWPAIIIFYLIYIAGLVLFVILPSVEKGSWTHALGFGAMFGLVTYATYDLVNQGTLKDWPVAVTVVDMAWGTFIGAAVSTSAYFIAGLF